MGREVVVVAYIGSKVLNITHIGLDSVGRKAPLKSNIGVEELKKFLPRESIFCHCFTIFVDELLTRTKVAKIAKNMDYVELNIPIGSSEQGEILVAELADLPFESFDEERGRVLKCYIPQHSLADVKEEVDELLKSHNILDARYISIETQNWNALWESAFERVEVGERLLIRAPFHEADSRFDHEIVIMPKMSFGTGHHATTHLMAEWVMLLGEEGLIEGRRGLDVGSGTGVLSIAAALAGAEAVDAVDIDEWADENCRENIAVNSVEGVVTPILGDVTRVEGRSYAFILANINRNILVGDLPRYSALLEEGGVLLMSGFLEQDIDILRQRAEEIGLTYRDAHTRDGWVAMRVEK